MDCNPPGSFDCRILQTRILEWVSSDPGIKLVSLASPELAGGFFATAGTREAQHIHVYLPGCAGPELQCEGSLSCSRWRTGPSPHPVLSPRPLHLWCRVSGPWATGQVPTHSAFKEAHVGNLRKGKIRVTQ